MNRKSIGMWFVSALPALLLVGCDTPKKAEEAPAAVAQSAAPAQLGPMVFAEFSEGTATTKQGTVAMVGSYSQKEGDHSAAAPRGGEGELIATGSLSNRKGSAHGGVLAIIPAKGAPADLSAYQTLKIKLSTHSPVHTLQVRVVGNDDGVVFRGCYPFALVEATETSAEYTIKLDDASFPTPGWCSDVKAPIRETLKSVRSIDIIDTSMPTKPDSAAEIEFGVGTIVLEP